MRRLILLAPLALAGWIAGWLLSVYLISLVFGDELELLPEIRQAIVTAVLLELCIVLYRRFKRR